MSNCDVGSPDCTILKYLNHTTAEKVFPHLLPFPPYVAVWRVPRSSLLKFGRPNMIFSPCKCTLTLIFGIWIWLKCSFWRKWHKVVDIRESITNKWPLTQHIGTKKQNMRTSYTKILSQGHSNVKYLVCIWILQPLRTHFFEVPKRMTSPNTQCIYIYISNFQRCWHMLFFPTCIFFLPPKKPLTKATVCSTLFFKGSCWPRTFPSNKGPWPEATTVGTKSSTFPSWKSLGNPLLVVGCNILILA